MRIGTFVLVGTIFIHAVVHGQSMPIRVYVGGNVTVTTSDSLTRTAISVRGHVWRNDTGMTEQEDFVFCITHPKPIGSKLDYKGSGRVVYRSLRHTTSIAEPIGPERILPALAVLQSDGESRFFLGKGQSYPHPPNETTVGRVTTFDAVDVIRQDYLDRSGRRRGTDPSSCFASER